MGARGSLDPSIIDNQTEALKSEKFLIVETNFKIYAYTSSPLYLAIFKLFLRVEYAFPDMIVATLNRSSLQRAFEQGITAAQILLFLSSHAHLTARQHKQAMQQNLMQNAAGSAYFEYGAGGTRQRRKETGGEPKEVAEVSIADLFGLSTASGTRAAINGKSVSSCSPSSSVADSSADMIPPNVRQ